MPAGFKSEWHVDDPIRFVHLYFTESHVNYLGLTAFDLDPRLFQLKDLTFSQDYYLISGLKNMLLKLNQLDYGDHLAMQENQQEIILYLLQCYSQRALKKVRGGFVKQEQKKSNRLYRS